MLSSVPGRVVTLSSMGIGPDMPILPCLRAALVRAALEWEEAMDGCGLCSERMADVERGVEVLKEDREIQLAASMFFLSLEESQSEGGGSGECCSVVSLARTVSKRR